MTLFSDAAADYLRHIKHERNLSPTTCASYQAWLHHFEKWLGENGYEKPTLSAFTTPVLRRFLYALSERGYRPRIIRGVFHPLWGLGAFLVEYGALKENPVDGIRMPRKDAARRLLVSSEELVALLEAVERLPSSRQIALSRALLSVVIYCGLRAAELLTLKVERVTLADRTLLVASGKGRKSRLLYPPEECLTALSEWLALREPDCTHDWLWAQDRGRRCGPQTIPAGRNPSATSMNDILWQAIRQRSTGCIGWTFSPGGPGRSSWTRARTCPGSGGGGRRQCSR